MTAHSQAVTRLINEFTWRTRADEDYRIDRMNLMRLTGVIGFLEHKFEVTPSDWVTLRSMGYSNLHSTPLMKALYAQLPIASAEATARAQHLAEKPSGGKVEVKVTTKPQAKPGMSLAALNGSGRVGLRREAPVIDEMKQAAQDLPQAGDMAHPRHGATDKELSFNTATVAAILSATPDYVLHLIREGRLENVTQDERTRQYSIPQASLAKYIAERAEQLRAQLPDGYVDVPRAARMLNCSHGKIHSLLESDQLNGEKTPRGGNEIWLITIQSVEDYRLRQKSVGPDQLREIVSDLVKREGNRLEQVLTNMLTQQHLVTMSALQVNLEIEAPGVAKKKDKP